MTKLKDNLIPNRPDTEPAISASTLTIDCGNVPQVVVEPRLSVGTRTINANFTIAFSNITNTILIHATIVLTGTIVVTMPSNVDVSDALPSFAAWDSGTDELTLTMGTTEKIELSFMQDNTDSQITLVIGGIAV